MIASATFYLAFTRKIYVAPATRCHICPKITTLHIMENSPAFGAAFGFDYTTYVLLLVEIRPLAALFLRTGLTGESAQVGTGLASFHVDVHQSTLGFGGNFIC